MSSQTPARTTAKAATFAHSIERVHNLKLWPAPFQAVWEGKKTYEVRTFDRDYQVGDDVYLYEYDPGTASFSGRGVRARITYITPPGAFGLPAATGVFAFKELNRGQAEPHEVARACGKPPLK